MTLLGATVLTPCAAAFWLGLQQVPVDRILPQLEARVRDHPSDAHGQYLLGRVHGAAFGQRAAAIRMSGEKNQDGPRDNFRGESPIGSTALQVSVDGPRLSSEALRGHLTSALHHLSIAVELAPEDALYRIGLACAFDSGASMAIEVDSSVIAATTVGSLSEDERKAAAANAEALKSADVTERSKAELALGALGPRALWIVSAQRSELELASRRAIGRLLTDAWNELAIANYDRAFSLTYERDRKQTFFKHMDTPSELISCESASSYVRLVKARGVRGDAEAKHLAEVEVGLETLEKLSGNVTPILVPDRDSAHLLELFDGKTVSFDLSGAGIQQTWEWPTADASFLVWDPECSGSITSGRQLFGSATWWMFFEDGYRALEALDVDGNGWLTGSELEGLSLWRDADRDGHSSASEVQTLGERGIVALATTADGIDGLSPTCSRGVMFSDNSLRPTFDWVTSPLQPAP